jgi:hypothetical protein
MIWAHWWISGPWAAASAAVSAATRVTWRTGLSNRVPTPSGPTQCSTRHPLSLRITPPGSGRRPAVRSQARHPTTSTRATYPVAPVPSFQYTEGVAGRLTTAGVQGDRTSRCARAAGAAPSAAPYPPYESTAGMLSAAPAKPKENSCGGPRPGRLSPQRAWKGHRFRAPGSVQGAVRASSDRASAGHCFRGKAHSLDGLLQEERSSASASVSRPTGRQLTSLTDADPAHSGCLADAAGIRVPTPKQGPLSCSGRRPARGTAVVDRRHRALRSAFSAMAWLLLRFRWWRLDRKLDREIRRSRGAERRQDPAGSCGVPSARRG